MQLIRAGQKIVDVDVASILTGECKIEDPILHAGDTVYVPESRF